MTENSRYYGKSTANDARIRIFIVYKCTKNVKPHIPNIEHAFPHHSNPSLRLVVEHGTTLERICSQIRPCLLPEANESAPRGDRVCSQRRLCLLPEATRNHRTDFKDDDALCIMLLNIRGKHSYKTISYFIRTAAHQQKQSLFR